MRKVIFSSLFCVVLCVQAGCSVCPVGMVVVNGKRLEGRADIPLLGSYEQSQPGQNIAVANRDTVNSSQYRVKYHPSYSKNRWMVVEGRLGNGRRYPVVLDTGASPALFVNDLHILENKLAICPFETGISESAGWGMCKLDELAIGQVKLLGQPCYYREQHMELQFFGIPVAKDKAIIAGMGVLGEFKHITFDSVREEVEFSLDGTFEPAEPKLWAQYEFTIEQDFSGNAYLFVKIPVGGVATELQLDTGSGRGLAIAESLWGKLCERAGDVKLRRGWELYPYIGRLACRRGVIVELEVGNRTIKNAQISVFPDDSELVDGCQGLLGMQYFNDTVMVLDFGRNLMWVKTAAS